MGITCTGSESSRGRLARIGVYFRVMFPLHVYVPLLAAMVFGFYAMLQATDDNTGRVGPGSLVSFASVFLSVLLLRLVDELKDAEVDPQLFPSRPLVTGAVHYDDVRLMAVLTILLLVLLNIGRGIATQLYFVYFVLFVLSWQWWLFPERVSRNVSLVLVTHQPLVPLLFAYMYAAYVHETGARFDPAHAIVWSLVYWIPLFAWEIARKVQAPRDETAYLTYTRRWGTRCAGAIPPLCVAMACAAMLALSSAHGLSRAFVAFHLSIAILAIAPMTRFLVWPGRATRWVRTPMEAYLFLFYASALLEVATGGTRGA